MTLLYHWQVQSLIASLTPEQIQAKQAEVVQHVSQQATQQGLTSEEATKLLLETLQYNGLPMVGEEPSSSSSSLASPVSSSSSSSSDTLVPGLPVPGTLEHTVALTLFNAQQYVNSMFSSNPIRTSDQEASGSDSSGSGSIMEAVSSLPQSVSNSAYQLLKFVTPTTSSEGDPTVGNTALPGQTYSEVVTGLDPAYAALGVLGTGALASVAYSYVASDADVASSAANLALGAVDAIARNDVVQNIANNDIVRKASGVIGSITGNTENIPDITEPGYYYYDYDNIGYSDYDYDYSQDRFSHKDPLYTNSENLPTQDKWYEPDRSNEGSIYEAYMKSKGSRNNSNMNSKEYESLMESEGSRYALDMRAEGTRNSDKSKIQWYEPSDDRADDIPYISYTEKHNPWRIKDTKHLYRSLD